MNKTEQLKEKQKNKKNNKKQNIPAGTWDIFIRGRVEGWISCRFFAESCKSWKKSWKNDAQRFFAESWKSWKNDAQSCSPTINMCYRVCVCLQLFTSAIVSPARHEVLYFARWSKSRGGGIGQHPYIYIYIYIHMYNIYIYIYREREREITSRRAPGSLGRPPGSGHGPSRSPRISSHPLS